MIPKSPLAAIRTGLIEWMQDYSSIQWDYYKSSLLPSDGAKGAVFIQRSRPLVGYNYKPSEHDCVLQLMVADVDHQVAQNLCLDWGDYLMQAVETLSRSGVTGLFRNVQLNKACAGIRVVTPGINYFVQDSSQRQDIPEGIAIATLQMTTTFKVDGEVSLY